MRRLREPGLYSRAHLADSDWLVSSLVNLSLNDELFYRLVPKDQSFDKDFSGDDDGPSSMGIGTDCVPYISTRLGSQITFSHDFHPQVPSVFGFGKPTDG